MSSLDEREELEFILERVSRNEKSRAVFLEKAEQWERMYKLDAGFNRTLPQSIADGQEQVILPTPRNVINVSERLLASNPRIDVIPLDPADATSVDYSEKCERWLGAMWDQINLEQQRNVMGDLRWQILTRGRFAVEVKWIKDKLPKMLRKTHLPFSIRPLEPMNVGVVRGPYCTEYAYHKYEMPIWEVLRQWPELEDAEAGSRLSIVIANLHNSDHKNEDQMVCVIDYWATDPKTGITWNAVLVEDEFAKPYAPTDYPIVPIICGRGDYGVGIGDEYDGLSILDGIDGLWQYECRLVSQMATALLWHFWPAITVQNETNQPVGDIDISPGMTTPVPAGTRIDMHTIEPNVPLAQAVFGQVEQYVEQSTYPGVIYGQTSDTLTSGYQVSLTSEAATGRIKHFKEGLEMGLSHINSLVLALIEKFGGKKGVDLYIVNERDNDKMVLNLNKEMIQGNYTNRVRITPALPQDDLQRVTMGKQLADGKYISAKTLLDKFLNVEVPSDETLRLALEELMQSDEMRPYRLRTAAERYYKESSLDMLFGTPFMPEPPEGGQWIRNDQGEVMLAPAPGFHAMPDGSFMSDSEMGGPAQPGPAAPAPMSGPPSAGPPAGGMGLQPGGPPIQPPAQFAGPMGGGFPPAMQGQLEGESLGLPQDVDPLLLDAILNTPASPDEQMNMAAGIPPEGVM